MATTFFSDLCGSPSCDCAFDSSAAWLATTLPPTAATDAAATFLRKVRREGVVAWEFEAFSCPPDRLESRFRINSPPLLLRQIFVYGRRLLNVSLSGNQCRPHDACRPFGRSVSVPSSFNF